MFWRCNILGISWAIFILLLCASPSDQLPDATLWAFVSADKAIHIFLFAILSLFIIVGFRRQYRYSELRYHAKVYALIIGSAYGLIIETVQLLISTGRHFDWQDAVADVAGSLLGISLFRLIYGKELSW